MIRALALAAVAITGCGDVQKCASRCASEEDLASAADLAGGGEDLAARDLATATGKRVFVTSTLVTASAAPAECQARATAAGLGGTWTPWLSYPTAPADAKNRVLGSGPWSLVTGALVFADRAALAGDPLVPISVTELGTQASGATQVWTGTANGGTASASTCGGWSSVQGADGAMSGLATTTASWTVFLEAPCNGVLRVYCFEG